MKIAIICFSLTGQETGSRLAQGMREAGMSVVFDKKSKYLPDSVPETAAQWAGIQFSQADGIIFVGACGIAVRSIAPYIVTKKSDPAVLVVDECGKFVISLLSGHLGGANELTDKAAEILNAIPVVTTATDLHNLFAVDVFARKNGCSIFHMKAAKEVSAALLSGEKTGFYSEFPWDGKLPEGLVLCDRTGVPVENDSRTGRDIPFSVGVAVTIYRDCMPFTSTVQVVPPCLVLGMGCKKDREEEYIFKAADRMLENLGVYREAFCKIASIDLKKEEKGIKALSEKWQIPFETFSEVELKMVQGEFTPSAFVQKVTGVDNVCERSAVLAGSPGRLIQKKIGEMGVTTAVAARDWRIHFE